MNRLTMGTTWKVPRVPEAVGSRMLLVEELVLLRDSCVPGVIITHISPTISQCGLQLGKPRHKLFHNVSKVAQLVSAGGDSKSRLAGSRVPVLVRHHRL